LELFRYVKDIIYEKLKIHCFLNRFPQFYKEKIEFDDFGTFDEKFGKDKYFYENKINKIQVHKAWKEKKENLYERKERFKPHYKNQPKNFQHNQLA
jgi:hypothetical protein